MTTTVLALKTISGEEVIATLVEDNSTYYMLERARVLVMQQSPDGSVSLGMLPFMVSANNPEFTTETTVKMLKTAIMSEVTTVPQPMIDAYLQQVSDIVLA